MRFTPYTFRVRRLGLHPALLPRSRPAGRREIPAAEDLFYQPLYGNRTIDDSVLERTSAAELGWRLTGPRPRCRSRPSPCLTLDGTETRLITTTWPRSTAIWPSPGSDASPAVSKPPPTSVVLPLAAVAGRLGGTLQIRPRPVVTVISDVDNSTVDMRAVSRMGGCEREALRN